MPGLRALLAAAATAVNAHESSNFDKMANEPLSVEEEPWRTTHAWTGQTQ
jgi:hypothetical protein